MSWGNNTEDYDFVILKTSKKEQTLISDRLTHLLPSSVREADHVFAIITACIPLTFQIMRKMRSSPLQGQYLRPGK